MLIIANQYHCGKSYEIVDWTLSTSCAHLINIIFGTIFKVRTKIIKLKSDFTRYRDTD